MKFRTALLGGLGSILIAALAAQAQVPGVNSTLASVFTLVYDASTSKPTYSATQVFTNASGSTDMCGISGSATKTIRVRRVIFSGTSSAVVSDPIAIIKRSTANTGGGGAMSTVSYSSANSATTVAYADYWTTNPTLGTAVGTLSDRFYTFANTTTGVGGPVMEVKFGELGSPVFLRGVAQTLNINGGGLASGTVSCTFEWTEDSDS